MIELCVESELVVGNTLFMKKDIHKYTWIRQDNGRVVDKELRIGRLCGCIKEQNRQLDM